MAIGTLSDFKIYHDYFQTGFTEVVAQNLDAFNENSRNAIVLRSVNRKGHYAYESFYETIANLDSRRINTSVSDASILKLTQDEFVSVKLDRKQGPVRQTVDSFKKQNKSPQEMSLVLGRQSARALLQAYLHQGLIACTAALANTADAYYDDTSTSAMTVSTFTYGMAKMKDQFDFSAIVLHDVTFFQLFRDQLTNFKIDTVAGARIATGGPADVFGVPFVITNDSALVSGSKHYTLLLKPGAIVIEESEDMTLHTDTIGGKENLLVEWQLEYALNLGIKGYKWDVSSGGANPDDTALGTGAYWDAAATDVRDRAGVAILTT
jgi:hypothetical protein